MEESITFLKETFGLKEQDIRTYSPLVLAYIGDGVYELYVRTVLVGMGNASVNTLNRRASRMVSASAQSRIIQGIEPQLTEEELDIYRRGRNAKSFTSSKHATLGDYRRATGFEALMGYLYLTGRHMRAARLVKLGWDVIHGHEERDE